MDEKTNNVILRLNRVADQLLSGKYKFDLDIGDVDDIEDEGLRSLAQKMARIGEEYRDCSQFILDLSHGKLNTPSPRMNTFAAPFKQLHAELRHLTWQIQQIANGDYGQMVSFSGDFSDAINKMIAKLRERRILTKQLDESNRTKDRLLSIIAHDLKGHFTILSGFGGILALEAKKENYSIDRIREFSKNIHTSASRTLSLLTNLLDWARLQSDHIVVKREDLDLNDIIEENVNIGLTMAESKGVNLEYAGGGDYPIVSDRAMINTILRNLISNAVKYTPQGGQVTVRANAGVDKYVVSVQDSGMGISEEVLNKLFVSDEIDSAPGTDNETGTGLGLVLCKDFVNMLDGTIWADSVPGCGATFYFSLGNLT